MRPLRSLQRRCDAQRMNGRMRLRVALGVALLSPLAFGQTATQEKGYWRAASTTARAVTGDLQLSELKVTIDFMSFTIAQIRELKPEEAAAAFGSYASGGAGNLYRLSIPAEKKFLHKNTLCGTDETQWMATYAAGKELQVAFFSGETMPVFTPEAIANTTNLCGTYSYVR